MGCGLWELTLTAPGVTGSSFLGAPMAGLSPDFLTTNSWELSLGPPCLVGLEFFPRGPPMSPVPQFLPGVAFPHLPPTALPFVVGPNRSLTPSSLLLPGQSSGLGPAPLGRCFMTGRTEMSCGCRSLPDVSAAAGRVGDGGLVFACVSARMHLPRGYLCPPLLLLPRFTASLHSPMSPRLPSAVWVALLQAPFSGGPGQGSV